MAEASAWLARLQRDEVTEADGLEFDAWLAAAPANAAAYRAALTVWLQAGAASEEILAELAAGERREALRRAPTRRAWMVGAGGFAVAAGLAVTVLPVVQPAAEIYSTGKGERRRVTLKDGSVVDLNAETRLEVSFARTGRRVVLGDGEAIFDVAHDQHRPFTVESAGRVVRVVGTQFDVRSRQGQLTVTVARGKVQVRPTAAADGQGYLLTPGQRLDVSAAGVEALKTVDPQETFGWRAGRLVYRDQPLSDVVADLNRQFPEQITIADAELGQTPITGVVVLDDPHSVISRLSLMLPIRAVPSEKGLLLLRK